MLPSVGTSAVVPDLTSEPLPEDLFSGLEDLAASLPAAAPALSAAGPSSTACVQTRAALHLGLHELEARPPGLGQLHVSPSPQGLPSDGILTSRCAGETTSVQGSPSSARSFDSRRSEASTALLAPSPLLRQVHVAGRKRDNCRFHKYCLHVVQRLSFGLHHQQTYRNVRSALLLLA